MLDPISVAGLAVAVFDQLLKLGSKTREIISEMHSMDEDFTLMRETTRFQIWRMDGLRLLFRPSSIYGEESLIQKFDMDAQEQIRSYLDELWVLLERALKLLNRVKGSARINDPLESDKTSSRTPEASTPGSWLDKVQEIKAFESTSNKGQVAMQALKWSFRDKKDLAAMLEQFTKVNDRLSEMIRFWSLASDIGVDLRHLHRLRIDEDADTLGCRNDASLALTVSDTGHIPKNFELDDAWQQVLSASKRIEDRFAMFNWNGRNMLQEDCTYLSRDDGELDPQTRSRINSLAELLFQPKEQLFCILPCQGWGFLQESKRVSYTFSIPADVSPEPKSLLRLLTNAGAQPSLEIKFHLARSLARSIAQLHMVKWVHESFRSENILFFPRRLDALNEASGSEARNDVDLKLPWIFGFEFSRPESFFSQGFVDTCPERDVYRHPERQGLPVTTFKKIHDIYALGVILLEIGIWRPAISLEKHRFARAKDANGRPHGITQHLVRHVQKHLENPMGQKYRDIVLKCLTGNFGVVDDNREDLKLQQAFRTQVLEPLQKIAEVISV